MAKNTTTTGIDPSSDLKDPKKDVAKMSPEQTTIELSEVKDIPGQENIVPMPMGELADDTISSADEEGDELFEDDEEEPEDDPDSDVSEAEKEDLEKTANELPTEDDALLREAELDDTDEEGDPLNEGSSRNRGSGSDLDIPGAEDDDDDEATGNEDEENNEYSLGGDNHDDIPADDF
jgi:hypothetical protein